ncbi:MAG TPA: hypothetical protein VHB30_05785 [Solirubrobacteraceae bacterium]|jgi:hypothetical protein|nr:hypothetical protein [Solirubrobacteraceae bacterium]
MTGSMPQATDLVPLPATGWRLLGFGKHADMAIGIQNHLRSLGLRSTNFALTDDPAGDARLVSELEADSYDGVVIGGFINGQDAVGFPATEATTRWFNRVLNIVTAHAPGTKVVLARGPEDVLPAIEHVLGPSPS